MKAEVEWEIGDGFQDPPPSAMAGLFQGKPGPFSDHFSLNVLSAPYLKC